jgi:endonuclease V-like protein UPF0215 family
MLGLGTIAKVGSAVLGIASSYFKRKERKEGFDAGKAVAREEIIKDTDNAEKRMDSVDRTDSKSTADSLRDETF